jgi:hypothetical protein
MKAPGSETSPVVLGRYVLCDRIASGGMATVHIGRLVGPAGFSRTVAVKRLHPQFAQDGFQIGKRGKSVPVKMFLEQRPDLRPLRPRYSNWSRM